MAQRRFSLINKAFAGTAETNDLSSVVTWANVPDANITESSVTQHQAALTITGSQVSDFEAVVAAGASTTANTAKVTNQTHTGDVTGSVALTIAAKAVHVSMLDDGTDGELITWGTDGVATVIAVGTDGQVLTSAGAGNPPLFEDAAGGGGTPTDITVADESTDTTCFPLFVTAATGDLGPKTGTNLLFNSNTGNLVPTLLNAIPVGQLLDSDGSETITGLYEFQAGINVTGVAPHVYWREGSATADEGNWKVYADGDEFIIATASDGSPTVAVDAAITIARTGTDVTSVALAGDVSADNLSGSNTGDAAEVNDLTDAVTWDDIPDANVPLSAVNQHVGLVNVSEDVNDVIDSQYIQGVYIKLTAFAHTATLEDSSTTTFPAGSTCVIMNLHASTEDITVTEGSGTTLYQLTGSTVTDTTGGCVIGPGGFATLYRYSATVYYIFGAGITP